MTARNSTLTTTILWVLAVAYTVALIANISFGFSIPIAIVLLLLVAFAFIHGAVRYGWSGIIAFIVISLVVSNILENTSILTGFPFGHYHYTDALGPKLFLVPLLIGPAYFANGYLAWQLGNVLVGDLRRNASAFTTFAVPFIASFLMVMWDLTFDPRASTIQHMWIWEQGGGYFGVPLTNYLGWFFTVYVFLQLIALFVRFGPGRDNAAQTLPKSFYAPAIVMYAVVGLTPVLTYLVGFTNSPVTDTAGVIWQTGRIAESAATVSIFTMIFGVALAVVRLVQAPAAVPATSVEAKAAVKRDLLTAN